MVKKPTIGWVVTYTPKNGGRATPQSASHDPRTGEVDGVSGHVYLYQSRKEATRDAEQLNALWQSGERFRVQKAELRLLP